MDKETPYAICRNKQHRVNPSTILFYLFTLFIETCIFFFGGEGEASHPDGLCLGCLVLVFLSVHIYVFGILYP